MRNQFYHSGLFSDIYFFIFQTQGLTTALTTSIMGDIQRSIRQKDEEMSWLDACCLHFAIKGKTKTETYTFQTRDPNVKKEWIVGEPLSLHFSHLGSIHK